MQNMDMSSFAAITTSGRLGKEKLFPPMHKTCTNDGIAFFPFFLVTTATRLQI
jgi:hypothetical protein